MNSSKIAVFITLCFTLYTHADNWTYAESTGEHGDLPYDEGCINCDPNYTIFKKKDEKDGHNELLEVNKNDKSDISFATDIASKTYLS